jgi:hydroxymethylpyrimidine/phosphomethylpyrimidine kinase
MNRRPAVLVIAATDSSGGAGLGRDVRVLSELGVDALCATTAVTAQSDKAVTAVHHVPPEVIRAQIKAAFDTRALDAIKIGMLGTQATVEAVAEALSEMLDASSGRDDAWSGRAPSQPTRRIPIVIDPVLVSSSGSILLDDGGRAALLQKLLPTATLVTPNVPEAAALLGEAVATNEAALLEQGRRLLDLGSQAILLKGGHSAGEEAVDLLISRRGVERLAAPRIAASSRGTGCALASAIAAELASGKTLLEACTAAKRYVLGMLTPDK